MTYPPKASKVKPLDKRILIIKTKNVIKKTINKKSKSNINFFFLKIKKIIVNNDKDINGTWYKSTFNKPPINGNSEATNTK